MLALRLPPDIEKRLESLARKTGRTKSYYAREAILEYLEDMEDVYLAKQALGRNEDRISLDDVEREFGLGKS
jgi:RHH-type rel operon transcriptional repressor/antitoxin RelB